MAETLFSPNQRFTRQQKNAKGKLWFKQQIDTLDRISFSKSRIFGFTDTGTNISEYRKMKINYDLFNNIINRSDFENVLYPFGKELGELPTDFTNKDILSSKIKALLGMEMRRPFSWKVLAVNPEATTRKEQQQTSMLKEFVVNSIILPIKTQLEQKYKSQEKELTKEEQEQIAQQIEQELQTLTPPEVKKYMLRDHQDPAEVLANQILEYVIEKENVRMKFNKAWKHALISGKEIYWTGIINGQPTLKVINPLNFDFDKSSDADFIEDGEWAAYETYMRPSEIGKYFGSELSDAELDEIYESYSHATMLQDTSFTFKNDGMNLNVGIRVLHAEWKSMKPYKIVRGISLDTGEPYSLVIDESYEFNPEAGDLEVITEWIPAKFEAYKIGSDKYAFMREVPGQYKDLDNLYRCQLSYCGAIYDNLNSITTSLVDRMKYYQYLYNIIFYRIELLMASDDGKKILLNSNLIPTNSGMSMEQWMYFFKVNKIGLMDPSEEGNKGNANMGEAAKEIDMSLVSDIQKYQMLLEYIERRCGESVGITKQVEGQIGRDEAVRNTQQGLTNSANILEPYFEVHNLVKKNVLQQLIEVSKVAFATYKPQYISNVLDDMSVSMLSPDYDLLENSSYGIFVSNSLKADEALQSIQQLSHAALQNQRIELSDVMKIMASSSVQQAQELLEISEQNRVEREQAMQQQDMQSKEQIAKAARDWEREKMEIQHANMMDEITLKGKLELEQQVVLAMGFNEDKDINDNNVPDVLEVEKFQKEAQIKDRKQSLEEKKFEQSKKEHEDKIKIDKMKARNKK
jgi:hypothetical protein